MKIAIVNHYLLTNNVWFTMRKTNFIRWIIVTKDPTTQGGELTDIVW